MWDASLNDAGHLAYASAKILQNRNSSSNNARDIQVTPKVKSDKEKDELAIKTSCRQEREPLASDKSVYKKTTVIETITNTVALD